MPVVDGDNPQHARTTQISDAALKLAQQSVLISDAYGYTRWDRAVINHDVAAINAIFELFPDDAERLALLNSKINGRNYSALAKSMHHEDGALEAFNIILAAYPNDDSRYAALLIAMHNKHRTLLHDACDYNRAEFVPAILHACPDHQSTISLLNAVGEYGNTTLHLCAGTDTLIRLLEAYPDMDARVAALNVKNKDGATVLHANANHGGAKNWEAEKNIQVILDIYPDDESRLAALTATDVYGNTALHYAVKSGDANIVAVLLAAYPTDEARQAALNHKNHEGDLPLHRVKSGGFAAAKVVLKAYATDEERVAAIAESDRKGRTALERAVMTKSPDIDYLQYLLSLYPDDDVRYAALSTQDDAGDTLLHKAIGYDFVFDWEEVNRRAIQVLFAACPKERLADVLTIRNHNGNTAFHQMLSNCLPNCKAFREMLSDIPGVENQFVAVMATNDKGYTLFHRAASSLHSETIKSILRQFPDKKQRHAVLTATDNDGNTSLHHAALSVQWKLKYQNEYANYLGRIKIMMDAFPDATSKLAALNAKNNEGKTVMRMIADMPESSDDKNEIRSFLEATKAACEAELYSRRASRRGLFSRVIHRGYQHNDVPAAAPK